MFLPKLRVLSIDPEENVKFIIGYLEKEGSGNTTRPFFENKAYPQFYEKDEETGMSIMDLVKECYERKESIEGFLEEAYEVVKGYRGRKSCPEHTNATNHTFCTKILTRCLHSIKTVLGLA